MESAEHLFFPEAHGHVSVQNLDFFGSSNLGSWVGKVIWTALLLKIAVQQGDLSPVPRCPADCNSQAVYFYFMLLLNQREIF